MNEVEELEKRIYFIQMQDRLSSDDYELLDELNAKLRTLKGE